LPRCRSKKPMFLCIGRRDKQGNNAPLMIDTGTAARSPLIRDMAGGVRNQSHANGHGHGGGRRQPSRANGSRRGGRVRGSGSELHKSARDVYPQSHPAGAAGPGIFPPAQCHFRSGPGTLYLQPNHHYATPDEEDMSGLHLLRYDGKTVVYSVDAHSPAAARASWPKMSSRP